jgi:uncharacterized membrane protein
LILIFAPLYFIYKGFANPESSKHWFSKKVYLICLLLNLLSVVLKVINGTHESRPLITSSLQLTLTPLLFTLIIVKINSVISNYFAKNKEKLIKQESHKRKK